MGIDLDGDDFSVSPWLYPGTPGGHSGLLVGQAFVELTATVGQRVGRYRLAAADDRADSNDARDPAGARRREQGDGGEGGPGGQTLDSALRDLDVAGVDERVLVVAIGSNASPAVMRRKFTTAGASRVTPLLRASLTGVAVGHSAHVSRAGYVPAAPFAREGAELEVVVSLLDTEQLEVLDATEPNYARTRLGEESGHVLTLESGERPAAFAVYVSTWGVVGDPDGHTDLDTQEAIAGFLRERHPGYTTFSGDDSYEDVMRRLAQDEARRTRITQDLTEADLVRPSGLPDRPDDPVLTYGTTPSHFGDPPDLA